MNGAGGDGFVDSYLAAFFVECAAVEVAVGTGAASADRIMRVVGAFGGVYVDSAVEGGALLGEAVGWVVGLVGFKPRFVMVDDGDLRAGSVSWGWWRVGVVDQRLLLATGCNDSARG